MARKQTLKSLLGGNDSRVGVDLNLDEQTFRAPTVRAGNYQVAGPVYSKTNALSKLSDSLERYSGPILKGYANIKEQQSLAMADATELLTPEQLKLLKNEDPSGLLESINNDKRILDDAQRKKLIKFAENPNNYERAYRRVGERAFNAFKTDFLTNMPEYAEDENFSMEAKRDELLEEYGLGGLGRQEFEKLFNNFDARTQAQFGQLKNDHLEKEAILESVSIYSEMLLDDTTTLEGQDGLNETINQHPYETQKSIFKGVVREMAVENPKRARDLITDYEEGDYQLGNGEMDGEFRDSLIDIVTNQTERSAQFVELQLGESMRTFLGKAQAGEEIGELEIPYGRDKEDVIKFTPDGNTIDDYQEALTTALTRTEDNPLDGMPETVRYSLLTQAAKLKEEELGKEKNMRSMYLRAPMTEITEALKTEILGENVNGLSPEQITSEGIRHYGELSDIVKKISSDPQYKTPVEKESAIMLAVGEYKDKVVAGAETAKNQKEEVGRRSRFDDVAGSGETLNNKLLQDLGIGLKRLNERVGEGTAPEDTAIPEKSELNQIAIEKEKSIRANVDEIYSNPELTEDEKAAGLSLDNKAALMDFRGKAAQNYVSTEIALLQEDISYDGIIGNLAENKQAAKDAKSSEKTDEINTNQDVLSSGTERSNVVINDSGTFGLARATNSTSPEEAFATGYGKTVEDQNPQSYRAYVSNNFVEDINTPKGFLTELKIGIFDNLKLSSITSGLPSEIDTIHKANQVRAIQFQQEGEKYMKTEEGQSVVAEFVSGETMTRVVRDGVAGMTIDELESGDIRGVKFNATALDQSATPILPFALLNKAFLDDDNLTPQEEQQVRDYADALYDTSNLNDADRLKVISKMVERQVNAYTIIGFQFGK
jgi:hypothetical protein